jgi:hypothetical protein
VVGGVSLRGYNFFGGGDQPYLLYTKKTSWSLLGPGVEVGLAPNIMKGINIFTANVILKNST